MRTVIGAAALCAACGLAYGQNAASTPVLTFEVASVKPSPPSDGRGRTVRATGIPGAPSIKDPGRFTAENFSLANLITLAYDIPHYRLSAPDELNLLMFKIVARMPVDTTSEQFKAMLQNLLTERFGLKVHWEKRQMETYELPVTKSGPKLKNAVADVPSDVVEASPRRTGPPGPPERGPNGFPIPTPGNQSWMAIMNGKAAMRGHNETAREMASKLSNQVAHPVTDGTGLTGKYDYTLYWYLRGPKIRPRLFDEFLLRKSQSGGVRSRGPVVWRIARQGYGPPLPTETNVARHTPLTETYIVSPSTQDQRYRCQFRSTQLPRVPAQAHLASSTSVALANGR